MRITRLALLISVFVFGCKNDDRISSEVLPQKKMQAILGDMMRADQFLADYVLNKDTLLKKTSESLKYYQQIFSIHKISKDDFQYSFSFYQSHPVLLKEIMDSINIPEKITPVVPVQTEPLSDTVKSQIDTIKKSNATNLQDTTNRKKRIQPLIVN